MIEDPDEGAVEREPRGAVSDRHAGHLGARRRIDPDHRLPLVVGSPQGASSRPGVRHDATERDRRRDSVRPGIDAVHGRASERDRPHGAFSRRDRRRRLGHADRGQDAPRSEIDALHSTPLAAGDPGRAVPDRQPVLEEGLAGSSAHAVRRASGQRRGRRRQRADSDLPKHSRASADAGGDGPPSDSREDEPHLVAPASHAPRAEDEAPARRRSRDHLRTGARRRLHDERGVPGAAGDQRPRRSRERGVGCGSRAREEREQRQHFSMRRTRRELVR